MISASILVGAAVFATASQVIVKARLSALMGPGHDASIVELASRLLQDPTLWLAGFLIVFGAFLWYVGLSRVPLSVAISFGALTYPLVMASGHVFLREPVSAGQILGCVLIVSGIFLVARQG